MLKTCNPIREDDGVLGLQKLLHNINDMIIVSQIVSTQVEFEFKKQEEVRWIYVW